MPEPAGPLAARVDAALDAVPAGADATARDVWRTLGRSGVLAELLAGPGPVPVGGLRDLLGGLDARCPTGVVLSVCVQVASALPLLSEGPSEGPVADAYAAAVRGEAMLALAATDAGAAGSDLMSLTTTAELAGDTVVLDGGKRWITNACTADHLLVLARHRPARHFTSFLWVLVPRDAAGVTVTPATGTLFAGAGIGHLRLDGVVLDRDRLAGRPGRGMPAFARHVATERLAGGLWATALCRRVLADTHRRLRERPLGGGVLWDDAAVRERFARCAMEAWRIEALCARYAEERAGPGALLASMLLKVGVADGLRTVLSECVQLAGADAYADGGLALLTAEAGMFGVAGGASGAMLAGIAEHADQLVGS